MTLLANLVLRLRALFGLGPRAEVMAYLLTRGDGQASEIARATLYSRTQVQEALSGLAQSETVLVKSRARQRTYSADLPKWLSLIGVAPEDLPRWIDWPRVFVSLLDIRDFLRTAGDASASKYLVKSDILRLSDKLRESLADAGIANPFERVLDLDGSAEAFEDRVSVLLDALARPARRST